MANVFLDDGDVSEAHEVREFDWVNNDHPALRIRVEGDEPYSPRSERAKTTLIPLDELMCRIFKRWLAVRPDTQRRSRPLFVSTYSWGERLSPLAIHNSVEPRAATLGFTDEESELNNFTPYTLRYFFTERLSGQPSVRKYILEGVPTTLSFEQIVAITGTTLFRTLILIYPNETSLRF